jgi:hypothetical protein
MFNLNIARALWKIIKIMRVSLSVKGMCLKNGRISWEDWIVEVL